MSMATPLMSDKARAWLSSVKGVPPNQISQHAIRAAQTGMISFGDAIALKQMADKLSGAAAQQNAPSPTSVVQDLKRQVQSKDMYGGVGSLPTAPAPAASPMESGIASLPAPVMDDAEYAGGGIVAFAAAGPTGGANDYTPAFITAVNGVIAREGTDKPKYMGKREGWSHWGISQHSHPELGEEGIKNLTRDEAIAIYHKEYWKGSGADKISINDPSTAQIVLDTAVLQGPPTAQRMIQQTNGDPAKMLDWRKKELGRIGSREGDEGNREGWLARAANQGAELGINAPPANGTVSGAINRTPPAAPPSPVPAAPPVAGLPAALPTGATPPAAGLPAALPTTLRTGRDPWAGVGTTPPGAIDKKIRPLADVLRPGAFPATAEEIAHYNTAFGPNWRTRYQGMTHPVGMEVTNDTVRLGTPTPPSAPAASTKPSAPAAAPSDFEATPVAPDAPLLDQIDVDKEMAKRGISKQDRLLMLANAGFNMAQAASQPGATFLGSAAVGGSEAAKGLASLNADQRAQRRALEEAAMRRQEAVAGVKLKERGLDLEGQLGLGRLSSEAIKNSAVLAGLALKADESMKFDPEAIAARKAIESEVNPARKAQAQARFDAIRNRHMGNILLLQQQAQVTGVYPGAAVE